MVIIIKIIMIIMYISKMIMMINYHHQGSFISDDLSVVSSHGYRIGAPKGLAWCCQQAGGFMVIMVISVIMVIIVIIVIMVIILVGVIITVVIIIIFVIREGLR